MHERALRVALTGGAGAGKSTLGAVLAQFGAVRIDADVLAREVVEPGTDGLSAVVDRFGGDVLDGNGRLDRRALGDIVFGDEAARGDLNAIIHPRVGRRAEELIASVPDNRIVVYEIPLLVETGRRGDFDVVVAVEASVTVRIGRLMSQGLDGAQARTRIAAQATDDNRRAIADEIVHNDTTPVALRTAARGLWSRLLARHAAL